MRELPQLKNRSLKARVSSAGRFLRERLVARPIQFARPYLKKGLVMRPLLFSFIVIGCVLVFMGVREYNRTSPAARAAAVEAAREAARPQTIAYADLASKGPGDNTYVRLTDFDFTDHYTQRKAKGGGGWEVAFVPAVQPREMDSPAVRVPKVLVRTTEARNHKTLYDLSMKPLEGIVVKGIASLSAEDQALLRKNYSHLELEKCWILEAGARPAEAVEAAKVVASARSMSDDGSASSRSGLGKIGGGAGLAVLAAGALLLAGRRS